MITASDAWIAAHDQNILPETFIELSYGITDTEAQDSAIGTGLNEAIFSSSENLPDATAAVRYATLEHNLWVLNGTRTTLPDSAPYSNIGYASQDDTEASVTLSFPEARTSLMPGITITWSNEYEEYPRSFTVTVLNGSTVVAQKTIYDNESATSVVDLDMIDYDSIVIDVHDWCLPDHRTRVDMVVVGQGIIFTKKDLFSFKHEQEGDLVSGFLPKNSITFSMDNSTGRWNPDNPQGTEKYLSERQPISLRYGMTVGNKVEWIEGGTFYLSEWNTQSQGLEATFVARDIFEYLLNEPYTGPTTGTLKSLVESAFTGAEVPDAFTLHLDDALAAYTGTLDDNRTAAEVVQLCANAAGCVIFQDRNGELYVKPLDKSDSNFTIPTRLSLSHPQIALSKPLKAVSVSYEGFNKYELTVADKGETQTLNNPLIASEEQAANIAGLVKDTLITRKTVGGEFRSDPRIDLYDIVVVESKYGDIYPVVITGIAYSYTGAFWATYTGRVLEAEVLR